MKKLMLFLILTILVLTGGSCSKPVSKNEDPIIEYDTEEMRLGVEQRLKSIYTQDCLSFGFIPDLHYEETIYYRSSTAKLIEDLNLIHKTYPISAAYLGGDNIVNSYDRAALKKSISKMISSFRAFNFPLHVLKGNHDDNSLRGRIESKNEAKVNAEMKDSELTELYKNSTATGKENALYSYTDFENQKVRIIYLNSIDVPYILDGEMIRYPGQWCYGYQQNQLEFFAKHALNFKDKDAPENWSVVILQHLTSAKGFTDGLVYNEDVFWGILDAYQKGSAYEIKRTRGDFPIELSVDYRNQSEGTVVGIIQGHLHRDKYAKVNGVNVIATKKSGLLEENQLGYNMEIFTIDTKNKILYSTRYGEGENREWEY